MGGITQQTPRSISKGTRWPWRRHLPLALFAFLRYNVFESPIWLRVTRWKGRTVTSRQLSGLALGMALLSWTGLGYVVLTQSPSSLTKALFFPLLFLAVVSVATFCLAWLRRQLGKDDEPGVVLRQGIWAGLYVSLCAGLQLTRVLDPMVALVLAVFFVLLEVFLLQRPERWRQLWYKQTVKRRKRRRRKR